MVQAFEGDFQLVAEIAHLFVDDCPRRMAALQDAIIKGDLLGIEHAAHSLKGSLANFGAALAGEYARRTEDFAHGGQLQRAAAMADLLERAMGAVLHEMGAMLHRLDETLAA